MFKRKGENRMKKIRCCDKCGNKVKNNKYFDKTSLEDDRHGIENYPYECLNCDENMFSFETHLK